MRKNNIGLLARSRPYGRGQSIVEFIMIFPVFFLFIAFVYQMVLIVNAQSLLNYYTFAACRNYIVQGNNDGEYFLRGTILYPLFEQSPISMTVSTTYPDQTPAFGEICVVKTKMAYRLMPIPILRNALGWITRLTGLIFLESSCGMTMESAADAGEE